jgi:hypothetical protein
MRLKRTHIVIGIAAAIAVLLALIFVTHLEKAPVSTLPQPRSTEILRAGPQWAYPDLSRTPGFTNPDITQGNIEETICNPNWTTKSIRPPSSYTTRLKKEQMQEWGLSGTTSDYEEDHFISLELGGNPTDPRNLWPEPYNSKPGAREKDVVENYLHKQVCIGAMTLQAAQSAIATDWYQVYLQIQR